MPGNISEVDTDGGTSGGVVDKPSPLDENIFDKTVINLANPPKGSVTGTDRESPVDVDKSSFNNFPAAGSSFSSFQGLAQDSSQQKERDVANPAVVVDKPSPLDENILDKTVINLANPPKGSVTGTDRESPVDVDKSSFNNFPAAGSSFSSFQGLAQDSSQQKKRDVANLAGVDDRPSPLDGQVATTGINLDNPQKVYVTGTDRESLVDEDKGSFNNFPAAGSSFSSFSSFQGSVQDSSQQKERDVANPAVVGERTSSSAWDVAHTSYGADSSAPALHGVNNNPQQEAGTKHEALKFDPFSNSTQNDSNAAVAIERTSPIDESGFGSENTSFGANRTATALHSVNNNPHQEAGIKPEELQFVPASNSTQNDSNAAVAGERTSPIDASGFGSENTSFGANRTATALHSVNNNPQQEAGIKPEELQFVPASNSNISQNDSNAAVVVERTSSLALDVANTSYGADSSASAPYGVSNNTQQVTPPKRIDDSNLLMVSDRQIDINESNKLVKASSATSVNYIEKKDSLGKGPQQEKSTTPQKKIYFIPGNTDNNKVTSENAKKDKSSKDQALKPEDMIFIPLGAKPGESKVTSTHSTVVSKNAQQNKKGVPISANNSSNISPNFYIKCIAGVVAGSALLAVACLLCPPVGVLAIPGLSSAMNWVAAGLVGTAGVASAVGLFVNAFHERDFQGSAEAPKNVK